MDRARELKILIASFGNSARLGKQFHRCSHLGVAFFGIPHSQTNSTWEQRYGHGAHWKKGQLLLWSLLKRNREFRNRILPEGTLLLGGRYLIPIWSTWIDIEAHERRTSVATYFLPLCVVNVARFEFCGGVSWFGL